MPGNNWMHPNEMFRKGMPMIGEKLRSGGLIDLAFELNPYSHFEYEVLMDTIKTGLTQNGLTASLIVYSSSKM